MACSRGCRLAQVDALLAWPFQPSRSSCADSECSMTSAQRIIMYVVLYYCVFSFLENGGYCVYMHVCVYEVDFWIYILCLIGKYCL